MIDNIIEKMRRETNLSFGKIMTIFLKDRIKYHITLEEFYDYNFYKIKDKQKETFINKKYNNKLIKKYNDKSLSYKVRNRNILYSIYEDYVKRSYFLLTDDNVLDFKKFLKRKTKITVSKIDGYGRDNISLSNIGFDKLFLTLFESNVRIAEDYLLEDSKWNKFNLKNNFTLNYIVLNNKIIQRTIKINKVYYNIDNGKYGNKEIPLFKEMDKDIINISKRIEGLNYLLIEIFPSKKGIELISINDEVPIIQNLEALNNGNSIKKIIDKWS